MSGFQFFRRTGILLLALTALAVLAACQPGSASPAPVIPASATMTPAVPPDPPTPTPTPPPLAATVNGEYILLEDFEAELIRYQETNPDTPAAPETQRQVLLDNLINQALLAQAAQKDGASVDDAALQARIDQLAGQLGGAQALTGWISRNHYTDESFRRLLRQGMLAATQRDKITAAAPTTAEQVHARQIFVLAQGVAERVLQQLQSGTDFTTLALQYDSVTGGELGWFPRGYLTQPEVEQAAFELQPQQYSGVIQSSIGFHIVYVVERDPQHPLNPDALREAQAQALRAWLEARRAESQITVLLK